MFSQGNRIRKTREFERVFASRLSVPGRFLRVAYVKNNLLSTRCGIVISTKVSKKAIVRNKLRRRIRTIITKTLSQLLPPMDIVIICGALAVKADYKEIESDLIHVLNKIFKINI
ncbi:MAG TPA: ribonuclease P protein component [bacterium]|nr:ribonuclease P protein component [bacterium]